ncbi:hypothetical protein DSO57_1015036 [Entomophthora muscae]|uniref:Uncharacterized protein n=1 Tax=Entomophthora muscae TaxID=34485 RepID=A0ACC2RWB4_9FUNG|nr:hypothetical protein DSO57_1015036 [Entomophthora muscae]
MKTEHILKVLAMCHVELVSNVCREAIVEIQPWSRFIKVDGVGSTVIVRAQSALDSQLASLEVIKHAAWKPPTKHFPGQNTPLSTNKWPRI